MISTKKLEIFHFVRNESKSKNFTSHGKKNELQTDLINLIVFFKMHLYNDTT